jgi:transcriptional regulator of heat shock response
MRDIFGLVVEAYLERGLPIGSKALTGSISLSPASIRNVMQELEERGLLTHPHTSAGRMPTDLGYREFVDYLMAEKQARALPRPGAGPGTPASLQPEDLAGEIDTALRQATDAMSRATNLLALALAPRVSGARLVHVELLTLHATELMYVFIVSTGGVMKGVIEQMQPVDPGLVEWARTYLNETLNEHTLTARLIRRTLDAARKSGAAIAAVPARDTVKAAAGTRIERTLDRSRIWLAQTPQVFRRNVIEKAYRALRAPVTDDAQTVEAIGRKVSLVMGDYRNIKITSPHDLAVARLFMHWKEEQ